MPPYFSSLPHELWDSVIDHNRGHLDMNRSGSKDQFNSILESYRVLCACCLVCQAWLPRSRLNLYSIVFLQEYRHVEQFLYALVSLPFLADHAHTLVVGPSPLSRRFPTHIPFVRSEFVLQLHNIKNLVLCVDWKGYPSHYISLLAAYTSVTSLFVWGSYPAPQDIHRIYRIFKNVGYMHLDAYPSEEGIRRSHANVPVKTTRQAYLPLKKLRIGVCIF
ncbi:hypothetical protein C8Q79DRAFT_931162 [Trametes meyenii]|nr:hypothetical protein C8Q79DRAFT_931162 [Trametes meyenii]